MLRNADRGGVSNFPGKMRYEGVRFKVVSITRGSVSVQCPEKKRYVTLEWPPSSLIEIDFATVVFRSEATDGKVRITAGVDEETERRVTRVD